jgi:hypothetical protein
MKVLIELTYYYLEIQLIEESYSCANSNRDII